MYSGRKEIRGMEDWNRKGMGKREGLQQDTRELWGDDITYSLSGLWLWFMGVYLCHNF